MRVPESLCSLGRETTVMAYGKKRGKKMPKGDYDKKMKEAKAKAGGSGKLTKGY